MSRAWNVFRFRFEKGVALRQSFGVAHGPTEERAAPTRSELRDVITPESILARLFDGMLFAGEIIDGKTKREGLTIAGLRRGGCVQLAGLGLRFGAGDELGICERKEISEFGRIEKDGARIVRRMPSWLSCTVTLVM